MIVRIVRMTFNEGKIEEFLESFNAVKDTILSFNGCDYLELYQDKNNKCVFFTYSYWKSEKELNDYRKSQFFKNVWLKTKAWFSEKPEAWSVDKIVSMNN